MYPIALTTSISRTGMAYVSGCEHDVFVSYAHLDNIPIASGQPGWVDTLVDQLRNEVTKRVGSQNVRFWIDRCLDGNHPITPEIINAIHKSATLLVVMSPSYLNSEWCRREREAFLRVVRDRVTAGSVFVVFVRNVERSDVPPEFGDLQGVQFWTWTEDPDAKTDRPLGYSNPLEQTYLNKVLQLSYDLKRQLDQLRTTVTRSAAGAPPRPAESPDRSCVFVARTTEDLEERETEIKAYLSQADVEILPQTWYPQTDLSTFEAAMQRDLKRCKVFAQLLSASRGRELPFTPPKRPPRLQYDIAAAAGTPCLLWRDRALDLDTVHDVEHRALLDAARATGLEEFKRAVLDEARRVPTPPRPAAKNAMVFVNADSADRQLAECVGQTLANNQIGR